jgi:hypothetical protein
MSNRQRKKKENRMEAAKPIRGLDRTRGEQGAKVFPSQKLRILLILLSIKLEDAGWKKADWTRGCISEAS